MSAAALVHGCLFTRILYHLSSLMMEVKSSLSVSSCEPLPQKRPPSPRFTGILPHSLLSPQGKVGAVISIPPKSLSLSGIDSDSVPTLKRFSCLHTRPLLPTRYVIPHRTLCLLCPPHSPCFYTGYPFSIRYLKRLYLHVFISTYIVFDPWKLLEPAANALK